MAGSISTLFVNQTRDAVKMRVGNSHPSSSLIATIAGFGGQFRMHINVNDSYREFHLVGRETDVGKKKAMIVTSDDCCDFQCITIEEIADGAGLDLLPEPRQASGSDGKLEHIETAAKSKPRFIWNLWVESSSYLQRLWNNVK